MSDFDIFLLRLLELGYQDSNLGPSGPKPDALTGLRYIPLLYCECKGKAFFLICKFFSHFFNIFFTKQLFRPILHPIFTTTNKIKLLL